MRKLGSFLVILLIITAYGRCVADQFGALHSSQSACCQTTCCSENCSENCCDSNEATASEHPSEEGDSESHENSGPENSDPCQLCLIISNDGLFQASHVKVPTPTLCELSAIRFITTLDKLFIQHFTPPHLDLNPEEQTPPPAEHRSELRRIIAKTTPVRGPSFV